VNKSRAKYSVKVKQSGHGEMLIEPSSRFSARYNCSLTSADACRDNNSLCVVELKSLIDYRCITREWIAYKQCLHYRTYLRCNGSYSCQQHHNHSTHLVRV